MPSIAPPPHANPREGRLQQVFEKLLWHSRWAILFGVILNIFGALVMVAVVSMEVLHIAELLMHANSTAEIRPELTRLMVEVVDGFLMAGVLYIFGFGLYELFISDITPARNHPSQGKILNIGSIDILKAKLGNLILMILIVKFFYHATQLSIDSMEHAALFAAGICLVGLALFLSHMGHSKLNTEAESNNGH